MLAKLSFYYFYFRVSEPFKANTIIFTLTHFSIIPSSSSFNDFESPLPLNISYNSLIAYLELKCFYNLEMDQNDVFLFF